MVALALRRQFVALVSDPMWAEYEAVLRRPELKLQPSETDRTLTDLRAVAENVSPDRTRSDSSAESDNRTSGVPPPVMQTIW